MLVRPRDLRPRRRIPRAVTLGALCSGSLVLGAVATLAVVPIVLERPPAACPPVVTTAQVLPAPIAPPEVKPPGPADEYLRAPAPTLDPKCLFFDDPKDDYDDPACNWDLGFPAISGDGTTVVGLVRDGATLRLRWVDVATGAAHDDTLITAAERAGDDLPTTLEVRAAGLAPTLARRVAPWSARLARERFRPLVYLGGDDPTLLAKAPDRRVTVGGGAVRIDDTTGARWHTLYQHRFDSDQTDTTGVWLDPATHILVATLRADIPIPDPDGEGATRPFDRLGVDHLR